MVRIIYEQTLGGQTTTSQIETKCFLANIFLFQTIRKKLGTGRKVRKNEIKIEHGHDGYECYKVLSRTRLLKSVGFTFLRRRNNIKSHLTSSEF